MLFLLPRRETRHAPTRRIMVSGQYETCKGSGGLKCHPRTRDPRKWEDGLILAFEGLSVRIFLLVLFFILSLGSLDQKHQLASGRALKLLIIKHNLLEKHRKVFLLETWEPLETPSAPWDQFVAHIQRRYPEHNNQNSSA